jgi:tetratricopeptide (TPR) repeat protein
MTRGEERLFMKISTLDSTLTVPNVGSVAPVLLQQANTRATIFRFLLSGVAKPGTRIVDLAAGPCLFAMIARDEGCAVTAVDARVERKPADDELGSIRFIQSDIRDFELSGYDVIVCLGMLYHFDLDDQILFLKRCAQTGLPVILETQIHVGALVPDSETELWARNVVRRGTYEGVVFLEHNNPMASVGNPESFWATEASLMQMIEDVGFKHAAIVDPIYQSKYGARRYFLLNCENFVVNPDVVANIALGVERAGLDDLVNQGRFDEARALCDRLPPLDDGAEEWTYRIGLAKVRLHFGDSETAISEIKKLRDGALGVGRWRSALLLRCAELFQLAGDALEAEKTRAAAYESIGDPTQIKMLIRRLTALGAKGLTRALLAQVEQRFAANTELLRLAANTYHSFEDVEAKERVYRAILVLEPNDLKLHMRLINSLLRRGDNTEAAACLESALASNPENPEILDRLASIHLELKNKARAERFARMLVDVTPLNPKAHFHLARALRGRKRNAAEALQHARRAAELDPGNNRFDEYARILSSASSETPVEPQ